MDKNNEKLYQEMYGKAIVDTLRAVGEPCTEEEIIFFLTENLGDDEVEPLIKKILKSAVEMGFLNHKKNKYSLHQVNLFTNLEDSISDNTSDIDFDVEPPKKTLRFRSRSKSERTKKTPPKKAPSRRPHPEKSPQSSSPSKNSKKIFNPSRLKPNHRSRSKDKKTSRSRSQSGKRKK